jgi:hypothetical protein
MAEYEHNHPPRCCCISGWVDKPDRPCPLCIVHGELAQLSNPNSTAEYPCCHQLVGRPHTDYCDVGRPSQPITRTSQPDTQRRDLTGTSADTLTQLDHTMRRGNHISTHLRTLCEPGFCGRTPLAEHTPPSAQPAQDPPHDSWPTHNR